MPEMQTSVSNAFMIGEKTNSGIPASARIVICGGGNGAHVAAAYLGSKPHLAVSVLTRRPAEWSKTLTLTSAGTAWESKGTITGHIRTVTDDASKVIPEADIIFIGAPANAHPHILKNIAPFVRKDALVGTLYAQGGFDWAAQQAFGGKLEGKMDALFGLQNIPWVCKATEYGKTCKFIGPKRVLWVTTTPIQKANDVARVMALLFDIPCRTVPNWLSLTLTPSNQIIHPARYYAMFKNWDGQKIYKKDEISWGLYTGFDAEAADNLLKLDNELQAVKRGILQKVPEIDLSYVLPIADRIQLQYGSDVSDYTNLETIFKTNMGYAGCVTPMTPKEDGFVPALQSRLFWEDIPYGLIILKSLAEMTGVATPTIDLMVEWHQKFMDKVYIKDGKLVRDAVINETAAPEAYGLKTLEDAVKLSVSGQ